MKLTILFTLFTAALLAGQTGNAEVGDPMVVIISMDGVRHDYPDLGDLPGLERMQREGARADRLTPVYPSNTFPGHVSLATGAHPATHGIVNNSFFDRTRGHYFMSPDTSWIEAEPLWNAAERQGVKAATYFWVGSEQPWRDKPISYAMAPFDGQRPEQDKVAKILEWLTLPSTERPHLVMSYWGGTDRLAHRYGPDSARVHRALRKQDQQLVSLQQGIDALGLWDQLTLMVVSDHGMAAMGDHFDLAAHLKRHQVNATVAGYTVGHIFAETPADIVAAQTALAKVPNTTLLTAAQARERFAFMHPQRSGDLVLLAQPPTIFVQPGGFEGLMMRTLRFFGWDFGGHGYDPTLPDMGAVWLLQGRGVAAGVNFTGAHQVDVAPTAAALLGIQPPSSASGQDRSGSLNSP